MKRTLFVTAFLLLLFLGFWSLPGCKKNNPKPLTGKVYKGYFFVRSLADVLLFSDSGYRPLMVLLSSTGYPD